MFTAIRDAFAITRNKGVFNQLPLYTYDGRLYAKRGSGFIALRKGMEGLGTSVPDVTVLEIIGTNEWGVEDRVPFYLSYVQPAA